MSEITISKKSSKERPNNHRLAWAAVGATILTAVGVNIVRENSLPEQPAANEPHMLYRAKAGDTEWSIGERAYPDMDPRKAQHLVDEQNPNKNHLITPGQKFTFGTDAEIGELVDSSAGTDSASKG